MLAWITYVPGDDLPALGGEAPAYRLSSTVSEDQVRDLAEALGLDGEITQDGTEWRVSDAGGTLAVADGRHGHVVVLLAAQRRGHRLGQLERFGRVCRRRGVHHRDGRLLRARPTATAPSRPPPRRRSPAAPARTASSRRLRGVVRREHLVPRRRAAATRRPTSPPSDEARDIALDLLAATGVDLAGAEVIVDGPYDAWYVTVEPLIDGVPSGLVAAVTVGSGGAVRDATGSLAVAELLGDYPLLDTRATIDRANSHAGSDAVPAGASDTDAATSSADAATDTTAPRCKPQADGREMLRADLRRRRLRGRRLGRGRRRRHRLHVDHGTRPGSRDASQVPPGGGTGR